MVDRLAVPSIKFLLTKEKIPDGGICGKGRRTPDGKGFIDFVFEGGGIIDFVFEGVIIDFVS